MPRQFRRIVAGGVLAGLAFRGYKILRDGGLRSLDPSHRDDERFRLHADNARDLVYRYRFHLKPGFEYMSLSSTAMTGYTTEEHYADPNLGLERVHPEDRNLLENAVRSSEEPLVLRWYRKDGALIWTEQPLQHFSLLRSAYARSRSAELLHAQRLAYRDQC